MMKIKIKTEIKTKKSRIICLLLAACFMLSSLVACGSTAPKEYPDALFVTNSSLVGYLEYVSKKDSSLTITMTEAMYEKTKPEDAEARKKHIAILSAGCFPKGQENGVIAAGGVYEESLAKIIPKDRRLVQINLTGSQILLLAEQTIASMILGQEEETKYDERFYHFTGVMFVYNKKNGKGDRIIDTAMIGDTKVVAAETYTVITSDAVVYDPKFKGVLGMNKDTEFTGMIEFGNEYDNFVEYAKEEGISSNSSSFLDKAERDAPIVTTVVLSVLAVLALVGILIAYFVMKKKQKVARAKRGGQPRIDV